MTLSARELVAGVTQIASLPEVYTRVNNMMGDPRYGAPDIAKVISHDPGLSARLLKIVNSPFYGLSGKIDTISRAITIVGQRELRDLILATSVVRMFTGLPNEFVNMESFWRHSVACALAARYLGVQRGDKYTERYFVAGLLHDIGSLIIYRRLPELARNALLRAQAGELLYVVERQTLGFDHAAVGGELLRLWRLPEELIDAVAYHHHPDQAQVAPLDAAIVHLANIIATAMQAGSSGDQHIAPLHDTAWMRVGLAVDAIAPAVTETHMQFEETMHHLLGD